MTVILVGRRGDLDQIAKEAERVAGSTVRYELLTHGAVKISDSVTFVGIERPSADGYVKLDAPTYVPGDPIVGWECAETSDGGRVWWTGHDLVAVWLADDEN